MPNAIIPDSGLAAWMQRIVDYFNEAANDLTLRLSNTPHDDDEWETVTLADLNEPTFPGYFAQVYPLIARPVHITGASGHYQVFPLFDFRSRFTVP
jgi:hypothetical protein